MGTEGPEKKYNSIEKCLQILSIFSFERPKYSLREISEKLNFNLSTLIAFFQLSRSTAMFLGLEIKNMSLAHNRSI